jgi:excinuclease ABC subunit B
MFKLKADFKPCGDQPEAIEKLVKGINSNAGEQVLLGVTGSGKTFTMANVIAKVNKPALIISHNKTLAAQLASEFKMFFPDNNVEYFVSYYDYYQPEAYIPHTDTYIEKDSAINDQIDRLRHSATHSLLTSKNTIIVASVSCIYGLGSPEDYKEMNMCIEQNSVYDRDDFLMDLINLRYDRNDIEFSRGSFRVRGDVVDIFPAYESKTCVRVVFFGDEIDEIYSIDSLTGNKIAKLKREIIYPATHYVVPEDKLEKAIKSIRRELKYRLKKLKETDRILEYERLKNKTNYDIEMMKELGYCQGIENYSRHLSGRKQGEPPFTLLDYFDDDMLVFVDESHVTVPQLRAMYAGDKARKQNLVEHGFRLVSAFDNRPLKFEEIEKYLKNAIFVSATPGDYEMNHKKKLVEQIIRPTGLKDPNVVIRPIEGQVDDLVGAIRKQVEKNERTLVTTLTKKMAEDLSEYLKKLDIKVNYLHSDVKTLERIKILKELRQGKYDVIVGVNLLREGLDLPEVSLVAILDADKEGFLRNERSLIQTMGRASRNVNGYVILYADKLTKSLKSAVAKTKKRREFQEQYNKKHNITPRTIKKTIKDLADTSEILIKQEEKESRLKNISQIEQLALQEDMAEVIIALEQEMQEAAKKLQFEKAAEIRDKLKEISNIS